MLRNIFDRIIFAKDGHRGFFGVFDGHGGDQAAKYVAANLYEDVMFHVDRALREANQLDGPYDKEDEEVVKKVFCGVVKMK